MWSVRRTLADTRVVAAVACTGPIRGAGLGLSIVRSVTVAHGGRIAARPRPGGGLTVEVFLSRAEATNSR